MEYISNVFDWTIAASIVGMVTGVLALIITWRNHRKVDSMKSLDLRVECKRVQLKFTTTLKSTSELHNKAKRSRTAVASATGMLGSGKLVAWNNEWSEDALKIASLDKEKLLSDADFASSTLSKLEDTLLRIEGMLAEVEQLNNKYAAAIQDDDKTREELRHSANQRNNF